MMQRIHALKQLYDIDDSQWLGETVSLLRNHQFQQLDLEHLIRFSGIISSKMTNPFCTRKKLFSDKLLVTLKNTLMRESKTQENCQRAKLRRRFRRCNEFARGL